MQRKIYKELLNWKNTDMQKPLMIIGARQIGKTYIIREFCQKEFKQNIYINLLEHPELIKIFKQEISILEKFNRMKIYLDIDIDIKNTIIFIDESVIEQKGHFKTIITYREGPCDIFYPLVWELTLRKKSV